MCLRMPNDAPTGLCKIFIYFLVTTGLRVVLMLDNAQLPTVVVDQVGYLLRVVASLIADRS